MLSNSSAMQRYLSVRKDSKDGISMSPEYESYRRNDGGSRSWNFRVRGLNGPMCLCVAAVIVVCTVFMAVSVYNLQHMQSEHISQHDANAKMSLKAAAGAQKPIFIAQEKVFNSGHLKHVFAVFDRLGFERGVDSGEGNWDVLWAHDYPFRTMFNQLKNLKHHQKVNHFPGSGYITNKVELATSNLVHVPAAFKIPVDTAKLLAHAKKNPEMMFVQKSNEHRGIRIKKVKDLNLKTEGSFVQEYVGNPLLVDGHKFDIGIYTILTSVDPLRAYIYNGDILFRYCPEKYFPFNPDVVDKYVVGDNYLPTWNVTSLKKYYVDLKFSMKESFDAHVRSTGKDPSKIWRQVDEAIRQVLLQKEKLIVQATSRYRSKRNFFEMVRFDFVVDEDLNVFLMEANMSPNLSSAHFPPNRLLYEQLIFNTLSLVGVGRRIHSNSLKTRSEDELRMQVSDKHLTVLPEVCASERCQRSCMPPECQLCNNCLTAYTKEYLADAYLEHVNKMSCKRIVPPIMDFEDAQKPLDLPEDMSPENQLMYRWFQGKCLQDRSWCS